MPIPLLAVRGQAPAAGARDPRVFADQIRQYLAAAPPPTRGQAPDQEPSIAPVDSPADRRKHVIAAAMAATEWIRARRATWPEIPSWGVTIAPTPPLNLPVHEPLNVPVPAAAAGADVPSTETSESMPKEEPDRLPLSSRAAAAAHASWDSIAPWLPRAAALVVLIALAAAGRAYWPKLRATMTNGTVVLESVPEGSEVFIDGRPAGKAPVTTQLPAGPHTVEFRNGGLSQTREIVVVARDRLVERMDWAAKPTGSLQASSEPTGARVLVDGEFRGTTPLTLDGLSAGTHVVAFESTAGSVQRRVRITANETVSLTELIFPCSLTVFSPFDIAITERSRPLQLDERFQIMLPPGPHELRFQNRALGYDEVRRVELKPSERATLSIVPPQTTISVTATEPAEVWIDGTRIGSTPLMDQPVNLGSHRVSVRTANAERQFPVTATVKPVRLDVDFSKPQP
jgi:hypothetical protein